MLEHQTYPLPILDPVKVSVLYDVAVNIKTDFDAQEEVFREICAAFGSIAIYLLTDGMNKDHCRDTPSQPPCQ